MWVKKKKKKATKNHKKGVTALAKTTMFIKDKQGCWKWMIFWVPSNPNHAVIL